MFPYPRAPYIPVHGNGQDTEKGPQERHAQQGVDCIVQRGLRRAFLIQVSHISKHNHEVFQGFGQTGDGVEGCQAADEAVHWRVEVSVPYDSYHNKEVLCKAHRSDGEEDGVGNHHLRTVRLVQYRAVHCWSRQWLSRIKC